MTTPTSRIERFVNLIGGEQNLPPRLPQPPPVVEQIQSSVFEKEINRTSQRLPVEQVPTNSWPSTNNGLTESQVQGKEPSASHTAQHLEPQTLNEADIDLSWDPRLGEPAPLGINFAPFGAVTKFCYKFVKREFQQPLATAIFDGGKIFTREWDLYYIWSDYFHTAKPTVFVPEYQFQALLDEINKAFPELKAKITDDLREEGLVISFEGSEPELRPRWLGHSTSRLQQNHWIDNLPLTAQVSDAMIEDRSLEVFRAKMEAAVEVAKNKSKTQKKLRHQRAVVKRQEMTRQLLRAQRYLGLLPKKEVDLISGMGALSIGPIDSSNPPPFPLDMDVILIAIDLEAYERPPRQITEVGVATIDTRDLHGEAPGPVGQDWHKHIRARHFRILEYKHLKNEEFVQGCPDDFEFGVSEMVGKDSIASILSSCFHWPFSQDPPPGNSDSEEKRNIVLLGHDISQDIAYMHQLGFSVLNRGNLLEAMDTAVMFRSYSQDPNPRSLGRILYHLDLTGWHPHNAGNDAVHTIWAMLAICVKEAGERGTPEVARRRDEKVTQQTEAAVEYAKERAKENVEGWAYPAGEDGGAPVPPAEAGIDTKTEKGKKPTFGPPRPPEGFNGLYTSGGVPLDV